MSHHESKDKDAPVEAEDAPKATDADEATEEGGDDDDTEAQGPFLKS